MTVKELIQLLSQCDPEKEVRQGDSEPIVSVEETEDTVYTSDEMPQDWGV